MATEPNQNLKNFFVILFASALSIPSFSQTKPVVVTQEQVEIAEAMQLLDKYLSSQTIAPERLEVEAKDVIEAISQKSTLLEAAAGWFTKSQVRDTARIARQLSSALYAQAHQPDAGIQSPPKVSAENRDLKLKILRDTLINRRDWDERKSNLAYAIGGIVISGVYFGYITQREFSAPNLSYRIKLLAYGFIDSFVSNKVFLTVPFGLMVSQIISVGINTFIDEDLELPKAKK